MPHVASSWMVILDRLIAIGLLVKGPNNRTAVSEAGRCFLDRLHSGCEDPDQIARLDVWCRDWRSSRPAVERYLRTFFARQKRFAIGRR